MMSTTKNMYKQCETCKKKVQSFGISMQCVNCCHYYHTNCVNIKKEEIQNNESWYYSYCLQYMFPFNHMDDDDFYSAVLDGLLNFPFDFHEMNNKVFILFKINESIDTPLTKMDPDIQFYSNSQYTHGAKCDYYLDDQFISKVVGKKQCNQLSFFHLNVKSIPKHFDELDMYINSLQLELTMIAIDTWLDKSKQDLYNMPKYNCINRFRKQRRGGGVSLYIRNDIKYMSRPDLVYFDGEMESLFIEID